MATLGQRITAFFAAGGPIDRAMGVRASYDGYATGPVVDMLRSSETGAVSSAVYACTRILSHSVGMLPMTVHAINEAGDYAPALRHPLARILRKPNRWQTASEFKQLLMGHLCRRGNFYAYIQRVGGRVTDLVPLSPDRMTVSKSEAGPLVYTYSQGSGGTTVYKQAEILHVRGLSADGIRGVAPLTAGANAVRLASATETHARRMFENGARPGGVLKHPKALSEPAITRLRDQFNELHAGAENSGKPLLLEDGLEWEQLGFNAEESQLIESRKFQRSEIAMYFGIPPHMLGDVERSTSWGSGIEQQGIGFVTYTLMPWLVAIQEAFERDLVDEYGDTGIVFRFDTDHLTRADFKTRQEARSIMKAAGVITADEWRRAEGLQPLEKAA